MDLSDRLHKKETSFLLKNNRKDNYDKMRSEFITNTPCHTDKFIRESIMINTLFFSLTFVLWNRIPDDIVLSPDLDSFKATVRKINYISP